MQKHCFRRQNNPASSQYGYTLFEILVVLSVIAFALTLSGSLVFQSNPSLQARLASETVASELRKTRSIAIADNAIRQWRPSNPSRPPNDPAAQAESVSLAFTPNAGADGEQNAFIFHPDGSANGGTVSIYTAERRWDVIVSLSGRVTINESPKE